MKFGTLGTVASLAAVMVACGGPEPDDGTGALEQAHESGGNDCREKDKKECVKIEADKNITHVFLDFRCDAGDFDVTLETDQFGKVDVTDRLKDNGGPAKDIDRDFWFVVPGPDKEAKVCVEFEGDERSEVKVSFKAANVAEEAGVLFDGEKCEKCEEMKDDGKGNDRIHYVRPSVDWRNPEKGGSLDYRKTRAPGGPILPQ